MEIFNAINNSRIWIKIIKFIFDILFVMYETQLDFFQIYEFLNLYPNLVKT